MKRRNSLLIILLVISVVLAGKYSASASEPYTIGLNILVGTEAFKDEMTKLGYIEGQNINYITPVYTGRTMEEFFEQTNKYIQSLIDAKVDVIVVNTDTDASSVMKTTGDIPVIFARSDDPVATGAVKSLLSPGGAATGIITNKPHERRLQILTEIKPSTKKIYYLYSTLTNEATTVLEQVRVLAKELGVEVVEGAISSPETMAQVIENTPEDIDWFFLTPFVFFDPPTFEKVMALAIERRAGITAVTDTIFPGYLMGYGPNLDDTGRQAARILDRILRGAQPSDLPVETAENYLTINLEAAQAIDLEIPVGILRQANLIVRPGDFAKTPMPDFFGTETPNS